ncbi:MAG: hypothetical protein FJ405_17985, partial [Verrucomicrobia bacterium]|nr:hypothetical protein [Verrucomicrobiota bacterium]
MKRFAVILLVLLAAASERSNAATPAQADPLRVQSARQEQIQGSSGRVAAQLDQILMEFELNGISGEDVNVLSAIRSVVHRISAEDMVKVIESLTKAREAGDSGGQQAADAFSSQRTIITQLRQVLAEYQRQQALHDIAMRLRELAARQTENMRLAVALARQVDRRNLDQYPETQRLNLQLQEAEESSLRAETGLVLDALGRLGESAGDATSAERIQKAVEMAKSSGLLSALDSAVQDLKNVRLLGAAGNEKKARDQMREIARQLTRSLDRRDALREALRELDVAMDKHQTLMERTRALQQKDEAIKREVDQADLVDATDLIRKDVDDLAPEASEHLEAAMERMQEARSAFLSQDPPARIKELAVAQQSEAQTKMEQARRELVDQLTKAESLQQPPENKMAAVEAMQMRIRELIAQQQALRKKTSETAKDKLAGLAPRQGDIKDQTQESQQQASSLSSEASEALGDAASQMQKSQKSLAESQNSDASQEAALEALSRAEEALAKEKEMLAQAAEELNQLEEILKKLVAIIEDQQGVFSATTRSALNPAPEVMPLVVNQQVMLADRTRSLEGEVR